MDRSMASAHVPPVGMQIGVNESIRVAKGLDRRVYGSCNACATSTQAAEYQDVMEVQLRGLTFRLCPACAEQLKLAL